MAGDFDPTDLCDLCKEMHINCICTEKDFQMMHKCGITPENITSLKSNEIFVFGSNLNGWHGAGAAKQAMNWGAEYGNPEGLQGNTCAVPTKSKRMTRLSLRAIRLFVNDFFDYVSIHRDKHFLITKIGCGLAGYSVEDIAPMFKKFRGLENVSLPKEFLIDRS